MNKIVVCYMTAGLNFLSLFPFQYQSYCYWDSWSSDEEFESIVIANLLKLKCYVKIPRSDLEFNAHFYQLALVRLFKHVIMDLRRERFTNLFGEDQNKN